MLANKQMDNLCNDCGIYFAENDGVLCNDCDNSQCDEHHMMPETEYFLMALDADYCKVFPKFREDILLFDAIQEYRRENNDDHYRFLVMDFLKREMGSMDITY